MLTSTHPKIVKFLKVWHENGRASFERTTDRLVYDEYDSKHAHDRRRYIALDRRTS